MWVWSTCEHADTQKICGGTAEAPIFRTSFAVKNPFSGYTTYSFRHFLEDGLCTEHVWLQLWSVAFRSHEGTKLAVPPLDRKVNKPITAESCLVGTQTPLLCTPLPSLMKWCEWGRTIQLRHRKCALCSALFAMVSFCVDASTLTLLLMMVS